MQLKIETPGVASKVFIRLVGGCTMEIIYRVHVDDFDIQILFASLGSRENIFLHCPTRKSKYTFIFYFVLVHGTELEQYF